MRPYETVRDAIVVGCSLALLGATGCMDDSSDDESVQAAAQAAQATTAPGIDVKRSLIVVDLPTLDATDWFGARLFSLKRVLNQLAATSDAKRGGGAAELYRRLFDTNNTQALGFVADGQHCDDIKDESGNPVLNGFPIQCPRQEGALADLSQHDPFCSGAGCEPYSPIAIVNRFDLAPPDGQTCGQYRIVFGKGTGGETPVALAGNKVPADRNLIIFEAVLPNPAPHLGLAGCAPVVKYWARMSTLTTPADRGRALNRFFFDGIPGFEPALKFSHFTGASIPETGVLLSGQIRTNQFMFSLGQQAWQLREYNVERDCPGRFKPCVAKVKLVTTKLNPSASLFNESDTSAMALEFRNPATPRGFIRQIGELARDDINRINMDLLGRQFNVGQSTSSPNFNTPVLNDTNYNLFFDPKGPFSADIQTALDGMNSTLTPTEIVRRAQTQACAGCHELSTSTGFFFGGNREGNQIGGGLVWPDAAAGSPVIRSARAFSQTSEVNLNPIDPTSDVVCDTTCTASPATCACEWDLSPAMTDVFLPARRANMISFLAKNSGYRPTDGQDDD